MVENVPNLGKETDIQVQENPVITQIDHECIILSEISQTETSTIYSTYIWNIKDKTNEQRRFKIQHRT